MKSVLTIEPDLVDELRREAAFNKQSLQEVLNKILRKGLISKTPRESYQTIPHSSSFILGIDPNKLNQLVDKLEFESTLESYHANNHS